MNNFNFLLLIAHTKEDASKLLLLLLFQNTKNYRGSHMQHAGCQCDTPFIDD